MLTESSGSVLVEALVRRFEDRDATIGIIGLGYVGLPLGVAAAEAGLTVLGFDIDPGKVEHVNGGRSYINYIADESIARLVRDRQLSATDSFGRLGEVDAILICVPTPLTRHREPDLSMVVETGRQIARRLRKGQLVVLESTTYPGTTNDVLRPILQESGLQVGEDFLLAYSPEREDPGNPDFSTTGVPKVVGADDESALKAAVALYRCVFQSVVQVPGTGTAEAVKLTENIFRAVNIALVNELKVLFSAMGIDIWDVIAAAKTKPFGFMPFYPGPGLGGTAYP